MHLANHFLIGLDRTEFDKYLLNFVKKCGRVLPYQKLHFLHLADENDLSDQKKRSKGESDEEINSELESEVASKVYAEFPEQNKVEVEVTEGNPGKDLLKISRTISPDYLILGRKEPSGSLGVKPENFITNSTCSTILVPAKEYCDLKKFHVAIDFSEISLMALKQAVDLSSKNDAELFVQHVISIPPDFKRSGKSYEEYTKKQEEIFQNQANDFLKEANLSKEISIHFTFCRKGNTADCIADFAREVGADLLIIGSKGRTNAASVLLGSIAKKVAKRIKKIPLMVIKKKNENLKLIDAILA